MFLSILCLVLVTILIGIVIWHIVYTVAEVNKLGRSLRQRYQIDTVQNRRLLSDAAQLNQLSANVLKLNKSIMEVTGERLPATDKAVTELKQRANAQDALMASTSGSLNSMRTSIGVVTDDLKKLDALDKVVKSYSNMFDPEKKRVDAKTLCLDNECISAAQLKHLSPLMMAQQNQATSATPTFVTPSPTIPSSTIPSPTIPSSTTPSSTIPSSTIPTSTIPSSTIPSSTIPSSTIPSSTIPSSTIPSFATPTFATPTSTLQQ
jgi:hypothetical protein